MINVTLNNDATLNDVISVVIQLIEENNSLKAEVKRLEERVDKAARLVLQLQKGEKETPKQRKERLQQKLLSDARPGDVFGRVKDVLFSNETTVEEKMEAAKEGDELIKTRTLTEKQKTAMKNITGRFWKTHPYLKEFKDKFASKGEDSEDIRMLLDGFKKCYSICSSLGGQGKYDTEEYKKCAYQCTYNASLIKDLLKMGEKMTASDYSFFMTRTADNDFDYSKIKLYAAEEITID